MEIQNMRPVLGGSLPVDNVQSLASKNLKDIPLRYIRPKVKTDEISADESLQIPVIDLSKLAMINNTGYHIEMAIKLMARNLGVEEEKMSSLFEDCSAQGFRMNYYPPCPHADKVVGLAPHSDASGLTLLVQVNQVQGLQIRKNSKWVPIKPIPDAIIINIGDVMEIMSNGEYSSIEHRAVVDYSKERLSIAGFHAPDFNAKIGPLPELVKDKGEKYKTISNEEYLKLMFSTKLDGKGLLNHMRIGP